MQSFKGILLSILILFPVASFAAFGDVSIQENDSSPTTLTTATSSASFVYSCVPGTRMETFEFYTRSGASTRTLVLNVDGIPHGTSTINTTPAWYSYTGINTMCTDGNFTITFTLSGSTYYIYGTQGDNLGDYKMVYNPSGTAYGALHKATFTLPLTVSTSTMAAATTTVITENDQLLNFFLLMCIVYMVLFGVVYLLRPFYARK